MSALEKLIKTIICNQLKAKIAELEKKASLTDNDLEKLKIEAMLEIINRTYESECR